ncbi:MAG: hypothetical protein MdMp014T_1756 [Treponematales bacterium]
MLPSPLVPTPYSPRSPLPSLRSPPTFVGAAAPGRVKPQLTRYTTTTYGLFPRYRKPVSARFGGFPILRGDFPALRGDVPVLRGDVPVLRGDVPVLRGDVPVLRGDVPVLRGDVPVLCGDVPVTRGDVPGGRGRSSFEIFRRFPAGSDKGELYG